MIGRMKRVPLREVWEKEAKDFTTWLYNNIEVLGEELELELTADEQEESVGSFSADITAEDGNGRRVVIENQLEKTDHTHLGQILTYISNLDGKVAIWISSEPRAEHVRAVEWLNETASGVQFYLVKVEAYKIDKSEPAAKFTVVTGPSEKTVIVGNEKKETAERQGSRLDFWKTLLEKSKKKTSLHSTISPSTKHWIGTSARIGIFGYVIADKFGQVELYIDRGSDRGDDNKRLFDELYACRAEIEKDFGGALQWDRLDDRRACRISKRFDYAGLKDRGQWDKLQEDMVDSMIRLEKAFSGRIKALKI